MMTKEQQRTFLRYAGLGWTMCGGMVLLTFAGMFIDRKFQTRFATFIGFLLGMMVCGLQIYKLILSEERR